MSMAVCRSSAAVTGFESILALPAAAAFNTYWQRQQKPNPTLLEEDENVNNNDAEEESEKPPGQFDIWTSIQAQKASSAQQQQQQKDEPSYVHPLVSRSSGLLSQKSLEICTESLGSETGSDGFFSSDDENTTDTDFFFLLPKKEEEEEEAQQQQQEQADDDCKDDDEEIERSSSSFMNGKKKLVTVNYHCSISRRSSLPRSFPPPLPSISRRDGPCLQMRPHRSDGRLVVEAIPVPSQNYLHAQRHNGRLLLSFINTTSSSGRNGNNGVVDRTELNKQVVEASQEEEAIMMMMEEAEADEDQDETEAVDDDEEEEEVEVVDRGTVVEVKVSTQPQQNCGGMAATKMVRRSSIVINKFVSCTPAIGGNKLQEIAITDQSVAARPSVSPVRRLSTATTTAAAAAVAASSLSSLSEADGSHSSTNDNKLLFTSKRRNREELMHDMRRCSQLRKPLFIWEPCCIATSI